MGIQVEIVPEMEVAVGLDDVGPTVMRRIREPAVDRTPVAVGRGGLDFQKGKGVAVLVVKNSISMAFEVEKYPVHFIDVVEFHFRIPVTHGVPCPGQDHPPNMVVQ